MVFNPDPGGVPSANMPDQTGASRGQIANRAWEHIFEGAGAAVKGVVDTANNWNKHQIDEQVREGFDAANAPFTASIPKELENSGASVQALQNAYDQGKISDTYYTGQLASLSKKLRSQYPDYEDYIDQSFQSITGIRPANAYRNAVMSELEKQEAEKKASASSFDSWVNQNGEWIKTTIPDYFSNPEKYAGQEQFIKDKVFEAQATALNDTNTLRQLEVRSKNNQLTKEEAEQGAITSLSQTVQSYIDGINTVSGVMSGKQVQQRLGELAEDGITPEEYEQGMQLINQFDLQIKQALSSRYNTPIDQTDQESLSLAAMVNDAGKFDNIMKQALAPWDAIKEYAVNKEWGLFTYYSRMITLKKNKTVSDLLDKPGLAAVNALNELGGSIMVDKFLTEPTGANSDIIDSELAEIVPELTARVELGYEDNFHDSIDTVLNSDKSSQDKAAFVNKKIDSSLARIMYKDITPEALANHVNDVYLRDEKGISLFEKIPASERETLYRNLFQPAVTDAIVKSGDQELMTLYYQSALVNTKNIQSLREAAATVQNAVEFDKNAEITYVPGTASQAPSLQLKAKINPTALGMGGVFMADSLAKAQAGINSLNGILATINPILTGLGADDATRNEQIEAALKMLSVDVGEAKKDNFFETIIKSIGEGIQAAGDSMTDATSDAQEQAKENAKGAPMTLDDTFTIDPASFTASVDGDYFQLVGGAESGNNDNAANPNSTATGRFQFLNSTYNMYAKRLGLTGSKNDPDNQRAAMEAYTQDSVNALEANGLPVTNSTKYALHFLGQVDGVEVIAAPDDAMIEDYVSRSVIKANKFLDNMTIGDFRKWLDRKMKVTKSA
jgi:hypothetical protein